MKKTLSVLNRILTILIVLFTIFVMIFTIVSVNTVNKEDANFFGYKPYIVLSDSMKEEFAVGDIAVSKKTDTAALKEGDIITFKSIDPGNYGEVVTHKIRQLTTHEGKAAYVTYGTTTGANDAYPVLADNVIGEYSFNLPKMGYFFQFLKSPLGYMTIIFLPIFLLIVMQGIKFFRLVRKYKAEQQEIINEQKAQVDAELLEAQKLKEELLQMRDQMKNTANSQREVVGATHEDVQSD